VWSAVLAFAPLIAFLIWKFSYLGLAFDYVEDNFFGRTFMDMQSAMFIWLTTSYEMILGFLGAEMPPSMQTFGQPFINPQHSAYYFMESVGIIVGLITIVKCMKIDPEVAWFSLAVFLISFGSGPSQGMQRYVLAAPAVFIVLAHWGKNPVFDRAWTIISILLMGLMAMLYAFNYWVA
jgi:hypothetical protein